MTTQTFEQLAIEIITEASPRPWDRIAVARHNDIVIAAQFYLDNLAEGFDYPDDLIELLAQERAADDMPDSYPELDSAGYSWGDGPYNADQWLADELPNYNAAIRSTYGMVSA